MWLGNRTPTISKDVGVVVLWQQAVTNQGTNASSLGLRVNGFATLEWSDDVDAHSSHGAVTISGSPLPSDYTVTANLGAFDQTTLADLLLVVSYILP
jgi:hypothetical protein